jgi:hypothetical protein
VIDGWRATRRNTALLLSFALLACDYRAGVGTVGEMVDAGQTSQRDDELPTGGWWPLGPWSDFELPGDPALCGPEGAAAVVVSCAMIAGQQICRRRQLACGWDGCDAPASCWTACADEMDCRAGLICVPFVCRR